MPTYPVLAQTLSAHPSLQIFRTYSALNLKSILYYQAELAHLEARLAEVEEEDRACSDASSIRREFGEDWWSLRYGDGSSAIVGAKPPTSTCQSCQRRGRSRSTSPRTQCSSDSRRGRQIAETRQWKLMCRIRVVLEEYRKQALSLVVLLRILGISLFGAVF